MLRRYRLLQQRLLRRPGLAWDGDGSVKMLYFAAFLVAIFVAEHTVRVSCFHLDVQKVNHIILDNAKVRKFALTSWVGCFNKVSSLNLYIN